MIKLTSACIEGFRLLDKVELAIESDATVIVGRNNSGKTSLSEVFERFIGKNSGHFRIEDFSASLRQKFIEAKALRVAGKSSEEVLATLPLIALNLTFTYGEDDDDLGPLSPFVIDLDPSCTRAIARIEYSCALPKVAALLDFPPSEEESKANETLFRHLRDVLKESYSIKTFAIDPTDSKNRRAFDSANVLTKVIHTGFVKAQRALDEGKRGDPDVIGKLLNDLFRTANTSTASANDKKIAEDLKSSVARLEEAMQGDFDQRLKQLLPALNSFGFPSLNDTELRPQTNIDIESLLTDNTSILYTGTYGVHLPEGYNGLGTRNLIYILLQLESLHKLYRAAETRPVTHLIFIEEPEAHLHPQMQEVFIAQLNEAISKLSAKYPSESTWRVQFVVSTHSSHLANAATFDAIRYFLNEATSVSGVRRTKVKDFRKGAESISPEDRKFLQQYMTLTKCDLYFADKVIVVEGATEKILAPRILKLVDVELSEEQKLCRQYITTIEAGGAHAQVFYPLLNFLELKTLVIADIDAVRVIDSRRHKCPCAEGEFTSNGALKDWFDDKDISVAALLAKTDADKIKKYVRLAYQMPESGSDHCARSYEDALILANLARFGIEDDESAASNAWELAKGFGKTEEAIRYAITESDWQVPRYIREGLLWLSDPPPPPEEPPPIAPTEAGAKIAAEAV